MYADVQYHGPISSPLYPLLAVGYPWLVTHTKAQNNKLAQDNKPADIQDLRDIDNPEMS